MPVENEEERVLIEGMPGRMLLGIDADGHRRFIRCDEHGFLLCKVISAEEADFDEGE